MLWCSPVLLQLLRWMQTGWQLRVHWPVAGQTADATGVTNQALEMALPPETPQTNPTQGCHQHYTQRVHHRAQAWPDWGCGRLGVPLRSVLLPAPTWLPAASQLGALRPRSALSNAGPTDARILRC